MNAWGPQIEVYRLVVVLLFLFAVAYSDLVKGVIPNRYNVAAIIVGVVLNILSGGWLGLEQGIVGLLAGALPLFLIYLAGLSRKKIYMGAGDVKLMAAIGMLMGPWEALWTIYYGLWVAGAAAVLIMGYCAMRRRAFPKTISFGACLSLGAMAVLAQRGEEAIQTLMRGA